MNGRRGRRRSFFLAAWALLLIAGHPGDASSQSGPEPHNILLIVADDVGADAVGLYGIGTTTARTPTLNRLAQEGVLYRRVWANPVCSPTRATFLTGRYGFRTGVGNIEFFNLYSLPDEELTLPEILSQSSSGSYACGAFGKWHLGNSLDAPRDAGFHHFDGIHTNFVPPDDYSEYHRVINGTEFLHQGYAPTDIVDAALSWIDQATGPWLCYVSFPTAHSPFHVPPDSLLSPATRLEVSQSPSPESDWKLQYRSMIEAMDTEMDRLLDGLGNRRNHTTVIFVGDNGTDTAVITRPHGVDRAKGSLYEGGLHVPLIISSPRSFAQNRSIDDLVNTTDLFATILDLAGVNPDSVVPDNRPLDSYSLLPTIESPFGQSPRQFAYAERFHPNGTDLASEGPCHCQQDLGYGGPGHVGLSICGGSLTPNNQAELVLSGAPPDKPVALMHSVRFAPTPFLGGQLTTLPAFFSLERTDDQGQLRIPAGELGLEGTLYLQALVKDPSQLQGVAISNTIRAVFPSSVQAIRDSRYKLIVRPDRSGEPEFYDLEADPSELSNLLTQEELDVQAVAHLQSLVDELQRLRPSIPGSPQDKTITAPLTGCSSR